MSPPLLFNIKRVYDSMNFYTAWRGFLNEGEEAVSRKVKSNRLDEQAVRSRQRGIYKFYCMLGYGLTAEEGKSRGLDDILADLRAIPNVTIVTVVVSNERVGENRYIAGLSVKYIPSLPGQFTSPEDAKRRVLSDIKKLSNVSSIFKVSAGFERIE